MSSCKHQVSSLANFLGSEAFPAECKKCGALLVRTHQATRQVGQGLFAFSGIPYFILLVLLLDYWPWFIGGTATLFLFLYWRDVKQKPLEVYTKKVNPKTRKLGIVMLVALSKFIAVGIIMNITKL